MMARLLNGLQLKTLLICSILTELHGITVSKDYKSEPPLSARSIGRTLAQCLGQAQKIQCVEKEFMSHLEHALHDNATWHYGNFMLFEKNKESGKLWQGTETREQRSLGDRIGDKLLQLVQSRSIRLKIPPPGELYGLQNLAGAGISNAVDDFESVTEILGAAPLADEGRKKKDKDKNMAMMGGMTLLAMLAQMFLGKVILIAGAAFVMAKIALLISLLGSLKKSQGGGGGGTDHVIVTGGGGGGGGHGHESSGWHRSMPYDYKKLEVISDHEHEHGPPPPSSGHESAPPNHSPNYNSYQIIEEASDKTSSNARGPKTLN